jgi:16S rRNA processing protein RimM
MLVLGSTVFVAGAERVIARRAGTDARPILRLEGCEDRSAAELLRGEWLLVPRERAPELEAEEWWAEDLEGCAVRDGERAVGTVQRLLALPSCELLEVARADGGPQLLVPLVRDAVRSVDIGERLIDIDLAFLGEA